MFGILLGILLQIFVHSRKILVGPHYNNFISSFCECCFYLHIYVSVSFLKPVYVWQVLPIVNQYCFRIVVRMSEHVKKFVLSTFIIQLVSTNPLTTSAVYKSAVILTFYRNVRR